MDKIWDSGSYDRRSIRLGGTTEMRNYNKNVARVHEHITDLKQIVENMRLMEEMTYGIEKELALLEENLPSEEVLEAMKEGKEKERISHLHNLLAEAYELIDEILGSPDDEQAQEGKGPISLEDILNLLPHNKRNNLS